GIGGKGVDAEAHRTLGEAGAEVGDRALAPFAAVVATVLVVAIDVGVAQQHVQRAVFDESLRIGLTGSECRRCACEPENDQTCPVLRHSVTSMVIVVFYMTFERARMRALAGRDFRISCAKG